jgi:dipeptidyl-peptidase-4
LVLVHGFTQTRRSWDPLRPALTAYDVVALDAPGHGTAADVRTGATRPLLVERDEAWVNLFDGMPRWLPDGSGFLWISERDGAPRLELRGKDGAFARALTPASLGCLEFIDLDGGDAYVLGCDDPTASHVYRISLDGAGPARVSREAGDRRTAAVGGGLLVDEVDLAAGGHRDLLLGRDGAVRGELRAAAEDPGVTPNLELVTLDGERRFRAAVIRPRSFDPALRYPVLLSVYAGPGVRTVSAGRDRYLLAQWQADHGMIVVSLDGRGTPGRGRAFERAIHGNLLDVPLADQVEGLEALGKRFPELDLSRVGVFGWSLNAVSAHCLNTGAAIRPPCA